MDMRTVLLVGAAAFALSGCGGGGGNLIDTPAPTPAPSPVVAGSQALAAGSYKLTFAAISTARLPAPISGIDVAVKLPPGVVVSTLTGGATGQITSESVTPGSAIQATALAFGIYSASTRTAYLSMATTQETYRSGQFLNLLFSLAVGTTVTPDDIFALNASYRKYKVVGLDSVQHSTVIMSGTVKTTLGVEH